MEEFEKIQKELLKHKYLYYELGKTEIPDREYDRLEEKSFKMARELGFSADKYTDEPEENEKHHVHWMVGFNYNHPFADEIIKKVNND